MAIFTRRFSSADDYEEPAGSPVIVKYQTHDKAFAPPKTAKVQVAEYAIIGAAFFALFAYIIAEL